MLIKKVVVLPEPLSVPLSKLPVNTTAPRSTSSLVRINITVKAYDDGLHAPKIWTVTDGLDGLPSEVAAKFKSSFNVADTITAIQYYISLNKTEVQLDRLTFEGDEVDLLAPLSSIVKPGDQFQCAGTVPIGTSVH